MATPWFEDPATIIGALGLVGGIVGWARSVVAGRAAKNAGEAADKANLKAADAQSDATAALERSADSNARIAEAVEILAQVASDSARRTPPPLETRGGSSFNPSESRSRGEAAVKRALASGLGEMKIRELLRPAEVKWKIEERPDAPGTFRLRNDGTITAKIVHLEALPEAAAHLASIRGSSGSTVDEIEAGSAVVFGVEGRLTLSVMEIKVWWSEGDSEEAKTTVIALP